VLRADPGRIADPPTYLTLVCAPIADAATDPATERGADG
jgi:hypothetical protein